MLQVSVIAVLRHTTTPSLLFAIASELLTFLQLFSNKFQVYVKFDLEDHVPLLEYAGSKDV